MIGLVILYGNKIGINDVRICYRILYLVAIPLYASAEKRVPVCNDDTFTPDESFGAGDLSFTISDMPEAAGASKWIIGFYR